MNSSASPTQAVDARYARISEHDTSRDGGFARLLQRRAFIAGAGNLGGRAAIDLARGGVQISIADPQRSEQENLGTQWGSIGRAKAEYVAEVCNQLNPGRALGLHIDVLHLGVGELAAFDLLIDATDSPDVSLRLTDLSNGLGIPLLNLAIDGSGRLEYGRVTSSHGGAQHACQMCPYRLEDLSQELSPTPCPGQSAEAPPTLAGNGVSMVVAGIAALQAQRILTGNDTQLVYGHEIAIDLDSFQMLDIKLPRCDECLSGHQRFRLQRLSQTAANTTMSGLADEACRLSGSTKVTLEPYNHPLCLSAVCGCGNRLPHVGSYWASPPCCDRCGGKGAWQRESAWSHFNQAQIAKLRLGEHSLLDLGMPPHGAMFIARFPSSQPIHLLLR